MSTTSPAQGRLRASYADAEQPSLLRILRRCSLDSDYIRWESLRGQLMSMGYRVVVVNGTEHLRALAS